MLLGADGAQLAQRRAVNLLHSAHRGQVATLGGQQRLRQPVPGVDRCGKNVEEVSDAEGGRERQKERERERWEGGRERERGERRERERKRVQDHIRQNRW